MDFEREKWMAQRRSSAITHAAAKTVDVTAALTPVQIQDQIYNILGGATNTTRALAMSVPSVARARNIICGTIIFIRI